MTLWTLSNAGASASSFRGNPNVTITAIDTSGGIACSRTSGKTPCFIQVSASAITATGTSVPYQDLSYFWNFGDSDGTEIFTNPATGASVNANNGQTGPEAAYCYRSAGTYTVTLTIIGKNGSGYVSATKTQSITVSAWSPANTWYYDANATGANNGTSAANAYTALTTLSAKANSAGGTQIYLAKGSVWDSQDYIDINSTSGLRISPTPGSTGANPIMRCSVDTSPATKFLLNIRTSSSSGCADVVVSNVDFQVTGSTYTANSLIAIQALDASQTLANIYLDNCSATTNMSGTPKDKDLIVAQFLTTTSSGNFDGFGMWGGSINSESGDVTYGISFFGGSRNWSFLVGLTNINGLGSSDGSASTLNHHTYQSAGNHILNRWIDFGSSIVSSTATRNFCVKIDNYPPPKYNISAYSSGAGGAVRLTVPDTSQYTNGANVYIENVTGSGAADITSSNYDSGEGVWVCSVVNGTQMDLVGTTYNGANTYTGGDVAATGGTDYVCVDGNNITGTRASFDANNNYGNINASWISNYVIQNNAVHDIVVDSSIGSLPISKSLTYRDNRCWNLSVRPLNFSQGRANPKDHGVVFRIYRNKVYIPSSVTAATNADTVGFVTFAATNVSWTNPQTFTDNVIMDERSSAGVVALDSFASDAAWIVDRNHYYAPASGGNYFYDGATAKSLAQWKAVGPNLFDANPNLSYPSDANYGDPGWTVPPTQWSDFGN